MAEASKAASDALNALNQSDITRLDITKGILPKSSGLKTVLEAVMILLNEDTDWENIQKVMDDPFFLKRLERFDREDISLEQLLKIKHKYMRDRPRMKVQTTLKSGPVSKVVDAVYKWVHSMAMYGEKNRKYEMFLANDEQDKEGEIENDPKFIADWRDSKACDINVSYVMERGGL